MSGRDKRIRRQVVRALDLSYDKVFEDLKRQMNGYPFFMRLKLCWLILRKKL